MCLLLQDGVRARYYEAGSKLPERHQLLMRFNDDSALVCTVQMYGGMQAYEAGTFDNPYYLAAKEKPHPLTGEFDENYFAVLIRAGGPKLSAKALLATEQRIPGLGNGCLQDILFNARINPQTKMLEMQEGDMFALYDSIKKTLQAMAEGGGRDTEKDLFGKEGGYRTVLSHKTYGKPCPLCGGPILRKSYMGGNIYFCPTCQPIL
jgi:formamidopyrimidine-DNA glycosylase